MNKALVIGRSGAGKSTFARELARITGLPLIHLDRLFWREGWAATDPAKWRSITAQLLTQDRWIIDGNFTGTMEPRIAAADVDKVIVFKSARDVARYLAALVQQPVVAAT